MRRLQQNAAEGDGQKGNRQPEKPAPAGLGDLVADVGAKQVHGAVRQVDVAHQAEHQGEAAGHQEVEAAQGDPVQ